MGTADAQPRDPVSGPEDVRSLLRAAIALRWTRPDLTATLAELAMESAADDVTWVVAAGWLLHGRTALGDGRDTACDLLVGLDRWSGSGIGPIHGPAGRRLRVELAGPARRIGEPAVARALLSIEADVDDDPDLRADVLTGLARCAVDEAPDTADDALTAAEQAWRSADRPAGLASVMLLHAARDRRAGRTDEATAQAVAGLATLSADGRRAGTASDHVAAALTAEWIAALVEAGRVDEARNTAVPAADRLIATARTSRQVAGLRLAIARVGAVADDPDVVLAALEPAARDAADSNVPELESACRSMLGELHEQAGRLDRALAELRAAMTAERRDRDRATRLRGLLGAVTPAGRPDTGPSPADVGDASGSRAETDVAGGRHDTASGRTDLDGTGSRRNGSAADHAPGASAGEPTDRAGRRARRRVAELYTQGTGDACDDGGRTTPGWVEVGPRSGQELTTTAGEVPGLARRVAAESSRTARTTSGGSPAATPPAHRPDGGSLIGDALLRELTGSGGTAPDGLPSSGTRSGDGRRGGTGAPDGVRPETRSTRDAPSTHRDGTWTDGESVADTVVLGPGWGGPAGDRAAPDAGRSRRLRDPGPDADGNHDAGPGPVTARHGSTGRHPGDRSAGAHGRRSDPGRGDHPPTNGSSLAGATEHTPMAGGGPGGSGDDRPPAGSRHRGSPPNGAVPHGALPNGALPNGAGGRGRDGALDGATGSEAPASPGSHGAGRVSGRRPGRPPATDGDGMGLADLLAGALAAYRDL